MNIFTRTFVIAIAAGLLAAIMAPALAVDAVDRPLEVSDALKATTHDALAELGIVKMHALADLLGSVTDESSARDRAPAAERYYIELELLQARMRMLPPVSPAQLKAMNVHGRRYMEARHALDAQVKRISDVAPLAKHLRSVTFPMHSKNELDKDDRAGSLASHLSNLRRQIDLYKSNHRGQIPDFRNYGWKQLTQRTDASGALLDTGAFGPYLPGPPDNSRNGQTTLLVVRTLPKDFVYRQGDCGFVYDESTGKVFALDADGRIFDETPRRSARMD